MLIIPAIDLRDGSCVRLVQGRKEELKNYSNNPFEVAESFQEKGAEMLHVVDLDGAFSDSNSRNRAVLAEMVHQLTIPVQFGGGLRSVKDVESVLRIGIARVVIGTLAVEFPDAVEDLVERFAGRICVGIDARDGMVVTRGWQKQEALTALGLARRMASLGVERIVYTDVSRDGMLSGINFDQTRAMAQESGLIVTASGGVSSLEDLKQLQQLERFGVDSVIVGKALYEGRFTLREALTLVK